MRITQAENNKLCALTALQGTVQAVPIALIKR
nr:MAG TPA: hypothetical protein [Caudoviricetes sp.]